MSEQTPFEFEREKWLGEYELRKRELEIKERDASTGPTPSGPCNACNTSRGKVTPPVR
jgi:hypothetical protein